MVQEKNARKVTLSLSDPDDLESPYGERESALEAATPPQGEDVLELGKDVSRISSSDG